MARKKAGSGGFAPGLLLGLVLAAAGAVAWFKFGAAPSPPVSKPSASEQSENSTTPRPSHDQAGLEKHNIRTAPFGISEDVFEAGAHVYAKHCAFCHGTPSHEAAGETFWKVANGIHQSGMPAYQHVLSETQMWQVSLLLKNADQQLPDPVMMILNGAKP